MWKKTAGIIFFVTSFILFMVYFANIENSKSSRSEYEETIRIQQRAIDRYNDYIEEVDYYDINLVQKDGEAVLVRLNEQNVLEWYGNYNRMDYNSGKYIRKIIKSCDV